MPGSVSFDRVHKLGGKLPRVSVGTMWNTPALKVDGRMLCCIATNKQAEPGTLVVMVDFFERDLRIQNEPDVYYVKPHYLNHPCVLARLSRITDTALQELLESGWQYVVKHGAKKRSTTRKR
ncbi:MAG TPA: hypothetical protein VKH19_02785 [Gemmatimonadaceae bacterium]|nr:hypothetical protein [Gemmatimonadaceae bacterium]